MCRKIEAPCTVVDYDNCVVHLRWDDHFRGGTFFYYLVIENTLNRPNCVGIFTNKVKVRICFLGIFGNWYITLGVLGV